MKTSAVVDYNRLPSTEVCNFVIFCEKNLQLRAGKNIQFLEDLICRRALHKSTTIQLDALREYASSQVSREVNLALRAATDRGFLNALSGLGSHFQSIVPPRHFECHASFPALHVRCSRLFPVREMGTDRHVRILDYLPRSLKNLNKSSFNCGHTNLHLQRPDAAAMAMATAASCVIALSAVSSASSVRASKKLVSDFHGQVLSLHLSNKSYVTSSGRRTTSISRAAKIPQGEKEQEQDKDKEKISPDVEATTKKWGLEAGLWEVLTSKEEGEKGKEKKASQAKELLARYGGAYLATSVSLSLVSFTLCYVLVNSGVDVPALLAKVGIHTNETGEKVGTFALAYAAHKAASPIRFPPTVALTPIVAGWLGKKPAADEEKKP